MRQVSVERYTRLNEVARVEWEQGRIVGRGFVVMRIIPLSDIPQVVDRCGCDGIYPSLPVGKFRPSLCSIYAFSDDKRVFELTGLDDPRGPFAWTPCEVGGGAA